MVVFGGMLVGRAVTTANMPADQADAQIEPFVTDLQAIFTTLRAGDNILYLANVFAGVRVELTGLDQSGELVAGINVFRWIGDHRLKTPIDKYINAHIIDDNYLNCKQVSNIFTASLDFACQSRPALSIRK